MTYGSPLAVGLTSVASFLCRLLYRLASLVLSSLIFLQCADVLHIVVLFSVTLRVASSHSLLLQREQRYPDTGVIYILQSRHRSRPTLAKNPKNRILAVFLALNL